MPPFARITSVYVYFIVKLISATRRKSTLAAAAHTPPRIVGACCQTRPNPTKINSKNSGFGLEPPRSIAHQPAHLAQQLHDAFNLLRVTRGCDV